MVRVRLTSGSHWEDGQRYEAGAVLDVPDAVYEAFSFHFARLSDEAGREPRIEDTTEPDDAADVWVLESAWADADATDAAVELALANDLWPDDVMGTGLGGRVLVGDVRECLG